MPYDSPATQWGPYASQVQTLDEFVEFECREFPFLHVAAFLGAGAFGLDLTLVRGAVPVRISARFLVPAFRPILVCPNALDALLPDPTLLAWSMRCAPSTLFRDADLTAFPCSSDTFALVGLTFGPAPLSLLLRAPLQLGEQFVHPPIDVRLREFMTGDTESDLVPLPLEQV